MGGSPWNTYVNTKFQNLASISQIEFLSDPFIAFLILLENLEIAQTVSWSTCAAKLSPPGSLEGGYNCNIKWLDHSLPYSTLGELGSHGP